MVDPNKLGYLETEEKLAVRIRANTVYANFTIQDWLVGWFGSAQGGRLLEIGCGDGNYFPTYAQVLGTSGLIIGMDINRELLQRAREVGIHLKTPTLLLPWDFDAHPYPLLDKEVDFTIAPFSAYYSKDVRAWVEDTLRVTRDGGRILLVGPTTGNARELYELNEMVTGVSSVPETDYTTTQLERAFLPEFKRRLGDRVKERILDSEIRFPCPEEFAKYYFATWLYEKTQESIGRTIEFEAVTKAAQRTSMKLSKTMICIEAHL